MKYIKYIIITFLVLFLLINIGVIIKYNLDLNTYINHKEPERSISNRDSSSHATEVYVVGSVHFETDNFKRDDLYVYLDSISPDIILYEGGKNSVNRMMNRTDFFMQIMYTFSKKNNVESYVTLKYVNDHPQTKVLPYEWEERDSYHFKHDYRSRSAEMIGSLIKLYRQNLTSSSESSIIEEFDALNKELNKIGSYGTVQEINNQNTDSIARNRQLYMYVYLPEIIKQRKELEEYEDFLPIHTQYWDIRNKAMASNILKQIKLNPNKRIVVLNGFYHRYYLIEELKKQEAELNFSIK